MRNPFLVPILPPEDQGLPRPGQRIRWPGEKREWLWTGDKWVCKEDAFDGGDSWLEQEEEAA